MKRMQPRCDPDGEGVIQMDMVRTRWRGCDPDREGAIQMKRVRSRRRGCNPDVIQMGRV